MKKSIIFILTVVLIIVTSTAIVNGAYNYGPNTTVNSAESLVVDQVVDSSNMTDINGNLVVDYSFGSLYDVCVYNDKVYIADGTSNLISVFDKEFHLITTFPKIEDEKQLSEPRGVYVTSDYIYVCDYKNERVLIFNHSYECVREVTTPDDPTFSNSGSDEGYKFRPKKITVDRTGRMYVIAEGVNEGIIDFNPDGSFSRYYGMNSATVSAWEAFWLLFTSEEQRETQGYNFGSALTNLCIDQDNYVYTVSSSEETGQFIKKLNYSGKNILTMNGFLTPSGDGTIVNNTTNSSIVPTGASSFVDIDVNDYGTYIALDKTRGRIFAYDFEGNLLYIGGTLGNAIGGTSTNQTGTFLLPEALCFFGDKILVVDSKNQNLIIFTYTKFASLVNQATYLYYNNDYEQAGEVWEEVLKLNTNYYLAYSGIGKAQLRSGDYRNAMVNLKLGYDEYNYSRAYQQYRYEQMSTILPYIIGIVIAGCVFLFIRSFIKNDKKIKEEEGLE